jgi:hypothetical protein
VSNEVGFVGKSAGLWIGHRGDGLRARVWHDRLCDRVIHWPAGEVRMIPESLWPMIGKLAGIFAGFLMLAIVLAVVMLWGRVRCG